MIPDEINCAFEILRAANYDNVHAQDAIAKIDDRLSQVEKIVDLTRPNPQALIDKLHGMFNLEWRLSTLSHQIELKEKRGEITMPIHSVKYCLGLIGSDEYYRLDRIHNPRGYRYAG